jgi:hypothetical protein
MVMVCCNLGASVTWIGAPLALLLPLPIAVQRTRPAHLMTLFQVSACSVGSFQIFSQKGCVTQYRAGMWGKQFQGMFNFPKKIRGGSVPMVDSQLQGKRGPEHYWKIGRIYQLWRLLCAHKMHGVHR